MFQFKFKKVNEDRSQQRYQTENIERYITQQKIQSQKMQNQMSSHFDNQYFMYNKPPNVNMFKNVTHVPYKNEDCVKKDFNSKAMNVNILSKTTSFTGIQLNEQELDKIKYVIDSIDNNFNNIVYRNNAFYLNPKIYPSQQQYNSNLFTIKDKEHLLLCFNNENSKLNITNGTEDEDSSLQIIPSQCKKKSVIDLNRIKKIKQMEEKSSEDSNLKLVDMFDLITGLPENIKKKIQQNFLSIAVDNNGDVSRSIKVMISKFLKFIVSDSLDPKREPEGNTCQENA
jgi:hypothetical protein